MLSACGRPFGDRSPSKTARRPGPEQKRRYNGRRILGGEPAGDAAILVETQPGRARTRQRAALSGLGVSSQTLMAHSYRVIRRMRYGTDSTRERHNDRAAVFRVKRLEGATACDP
jgi:hypothetical protein